MIKSIVERTAKIYVADDYHSVPRPAETTSPEYLDRDWLLNRQFNRIVAANTEDELFKAYIRVAEATDQVERSQDGELEALAQLKRGMQGKDLLRELATNHSFAWVDVARMLGVSVPAVRKWRMSGGFSADNVAKLARLTAFTEILAAGGVRAASWLSAPMVVGYTVAPKHLYTDERAATLLDMASGGQEPTRVLDAVLPNWRSEYDAHGFVVAKFDDGTFGIVSGGK